MANPTQVIDALTTRLAKHLWLQQFDLDEPTADLVSHNTHLYPSNTVFIAPPSQVGVERLGSGQDQPLRAMLTYSMSIQYRFNKGVWPTANTVPFKQLTSLYYYIATWLTLISESDVTRISLPQRANPITFGETDTLADQTNRWETTLGDWLVTMWFDIAVEFNTDIDDYSPDLWTDIQPPDFPGGYVPEQPIELTELNIGIYRNKLTEPLNTTESVLDHTIIITE